MGSKKPSGRLNRGPWTGKQIADALFSQGYYEQPGGSHPQLKHPTRRGKVTIDYKWTGIKAGSQMFNSVARQAGYTKQQFLRLMNGLPSDG
jgi:predicted RNA binding protein YcfA (HicA-like mRNA interferase family)